MRTTIDKAGRIVVPKPLRDLLGLSAGTRLEILESEGEMILRPTGPETRVERRQGRPVIEVEDEVQPLTQDEVRELVERTRR